MTRNCVMPSSYTQTDTHTHTHKHTHTLDAMRTSKTYTCRTTSCHTHTSSSHTCARTQTNASLAPHFFSNKKQKNKAYGKPWQRRRRTGHQRVTRWRSLACPLRFSSGPQSRALHPQQTTFSIPISTSRVQAYAHHSIRYRIPPCACRIPPCAYLVPTAFDRVP